MPAADRDAPLAIGGAPSADHYSLPTKMVEVVLRDAGWRATSLGVGLPLETMREAIERSQPRLFWLSVSHLEDEEAFLEQYAQLLESAGALTAIVVGGRALKDSLRVRMTYAAYCDNLQHLESFAAAMLSTVHGDD
jgi:methanogenic corrinoid protein MtbC1